MGEQKYPESVAALKAELSRLEGELRTADEAGDRRVALNVLARMLQLQQRFMQRWARTPTPVKGNPSRGEGGGGSEGDPGDSAPPHELNDPGQGR